MKVQSEMQVLPSGLVLLDTKTLAAAAAMDFTQYIDSTYDEYEIHLQGIQQSSSSGLALRTTANGGTLWNSTLGDYRWAACMNDGAAGSDFDVTTSDTNIGLIGALSGVTTSPNSLWRICMTPSGWFSGWQLRAISFWGLSFRPSDSASIIFDFT